MAYPHLYRPSFRGRFYHPDRGSSSEFARTATNEDDVRASPTQPILARSVGADSVGPGPCCECRESFICCGRNLGDWDAVLMYTTAKRVQLRHRWLGLLYYALALTAVGYVIGYDIIWERGYQLPEEIDAASRVSITLPPLEDIKGAMGDADYCSGSGRPVDPGRRHHCMAALVSDVTRPPAIIPSQMLVTTRMTNDVYRAQQCDWRTVPGCALPEPEVETVFFAGVENVTVHLSHVIVTVGDGLPGHHRLLGSLVSFCDGEAIRTIPGGTDVAASSTTFTLQELLRAADSSECGGRAFHDLDDVDVGGGNTTLRYDGLRLVLKIQYTKHATSSDISYTLRVTAVTQQRGEVDFADNGCSTNHTGMQDCVVQRRAGVLLTVSAAGTVGTFDFMTLLIRLAAGWALLGLAASITDFAAVWLFRCRVTRGGGWCPCCAGSADVRGGADDTWNNAYYRYMYDPSQDLGDVLHRNRPDLRKEQLEEWEHAAQLAGKSSRFHFQVIADLQDKIRRMEDTLMLSGPPAMQGPPALTPSPTPSPTSTAKTNPSRQHERRASDTWKRAGTTTKAPPAPAAPSVNIIPSSLADKRTQPKKPDRQVRMSPPESQVSEGSGSASRQRTSAPRPGEDSGSGGFGATFGQFEETMRVGPGDYDDDEAPDEDSRR
eukprot:TRINITY_DN32602_c0_g1_i1.p1 TRINITY_DN32602_c0_g1~~TRINITY_DN32602_c0_g1_i1.p1  ORF type:complete len:682 (+),score=160.34 TRINITY_DN32602_c0_g1_i1:65-2047(+)